MSEFKGAERIYEFADSLDAAGEATGAATGTEARWETWVAFSLAGETYAFPVGAMLEILRVGAVTRVPDAPHPVRGIINLRGRVVPVVDLRVRLGLDAVPPGPASRILIAEARERAIGLLVDAVEQVVRLDANTFSPPPADVMTAQSHYITAVCRLNDTLYILLDPERVLILAPDAAAARAY